MGKTIDPNHALHETVLFKDTFVTKSIDPNGKKLFLVSRLRSVGTESKTWLELDFQNKICSQLSDTKSMDIRFVVKTVKPNTMDMNEPERTHSTEDNHVCDKTCTERHKWDCLCGCELKHKQKQVKGKWDYEFRGDVIRVSKSTQGIVEMYISIGGLLCALVGESKYLNDAMNHSEVYLQFYL